MTKFNFSLYRSQNKNRTGQRISPPTQAARKQHFQTNEHTITVRKIIIGKKLIRSDVQKSKERYSFKIRKRVNSWPSQIHQV